MIQLSDLTKSFGDRVLLDHVTWQIDDGDRVGLCGPNGAGKTTLLKMLGRHDEPDSGTIAMPAGVFTEAVRDGSLTLIWLIGVPVVFIHRGFRRTHPLALKKRIGRTVH